MPRVYSKKKSTRGSKYTCYACGKIIEPGQMYYEFQKRHQAPRRKHQACGYPKASDLSNRKTAIIEDAISDADWHTEMDLPVDAVPGGTVEVEWQHLADQLASIGDEAEGVADEYESSADNMPENLQDGYQAEAMREVAQELRDWADNLRDWQPDSYVADLPDADEYTNDEGEFDDASWHDAAQDAVDQVCGDLADEAQQLTEGMPEYQG